MAENNRTEENRAIDERIARTIKRAARRGKRLTFKNTNNVREFSQEPGPLSNEFQRATIVGPNYRLPMRNWTTMVNAGVTRRAPGVRASGPVVPILPNNNTRRNNAWSIERNRLRAIAYNEARHLGINERPRLGPNAARAQGKRNHLIALEENEEPNSLNQFVSQPLPASTARPGRPVRPQSASPARSALGAMGRASIAIAQTGPLTREQRIASGPKISLATARPVPNRAAAASAAANRRAALARANHERRMAAIRSIRGGTRRTRRKNRRS